MLKKAREKRKPLRLEIYNYPAGLWDDSKKEPPFKIINGSQDMQQYEPINKTIKTSAWHNQEGMPIWWS